MIKIGAYDRKITIERSSSSTFDETGFPIYVWTPIYTVWSNVVTISGGEALRLDRQIATQIARFFIRHNPDITVKDRILYNAKYWDILNIKEIGRSEALEITAEQVE